MESSPYKHVFGPVPSRRLGRSLGVDVVPFKTCTYDCVYCQIGHTTHKTSSRGDFVPLDDVLAEICRKLDSGAAPDYITISGSGEPTLYACLGDLVNRIKETTDVPVAVITNGSLLWREDVQADLQQVDLLVPSLDAADAAAFVHVNHPAPEIDFDRMLEGLFTLRDVFPGTIWLEVLLVDGITDDEATVERLGRFIDRIRPDRIQLNTVVRPPADSWSGPVSRERLETIAKQLGERAEVVADIPVEGLSGCSRSTEDDVLATLKRRPCSAEDVAQGLGINLLEAQKHLAHLVDRGEAVTQRRENTIYFVAKDRQ